MTSALEFYKLLPKTNCGDCGLPTCLAFAIKLTSKDTDITKCPHLDESVSKELSSASLPAVKEIVLSTEGHSVRLGGETVFFRHEKKFYNESALCITLFDTDSTDTISRKLQERAIDRLAMELTTNMIGIVNSSNQPQLFLDLVKFVKENSDLPLVLYSEDTETLQKSLALLSKNERALIGPVTKMNKDNLLEVAKTHNCVIFLSNFEDFEELSELVSEAQLKGIQDIVIDCSVGTLKETLERQIRCRWLAVNEKNRSVGYPIISFSYLFANTPLNETLVASLFIAKYSSIVLFSSNDFNHLVPLLVLRQNIFSDPQKPIQVDARLYAIGEVTEDSPVFLTTNFSLTYFTVLTDIESTNIPSYLLIVDTEGTSVLTAFASNKINEDKIAEAIKESDLETKVTHRKIIIPGFLSPLSGKIEEQSGWKVLVGPTDSAQITPFLKNHWRLNND